MRHLGEILAEYPHCRHRLPNNLVFMLKVLGEFSGAVDGLDMAVDKGEIRAVAMCANPEHTVGRGSNRRRRPLVAIGVIKGDVASAVGISNPQERRRLLYLVQKHKGVSVRVGAPTRGHVDVVASRYLDATATIRLIRGSVPEWHSARTDSLVRRRARQVAGVPVVVPTQAPYPVRRPIDILLVS